jgi:hypothetical protein
VGYGVLWMVLSGRISPPLYWLASKKERKLKEIAQIYVVQQQQQQQQQLCLFLFLF